MRLQVAVPVASPSSGPQGTTDPREAEEEAGLGEGGAAWPGERERGGRGGSPACPTPSTCQPTERRIFTPCLASPEKQVKDDDDADYHYGFG